MEKEIRDAITKALGKLGIEPVEFVVEHPVDLGHGDYSTNAAMVIAKKVGKNPCELAETLTEELSIAFVEKIEIAGSGFINFYLSRDFFTKSLSVIEKSGKDFGKNERLKGHNVIIEYTDPNPFKEFHIGHLMSNAIGESISRLIEFSGAEVSRANYQGDVGLHVAKAIWGKQQKPEASWGQAYVIGAQAYDTHKEEINILNKKIYERADKKVNELYAKGKKETLTEFEKIYKILGTKFDEYFFESEAGEFGKKLVENNLGSIFEGIVEGANTTTIFRGDDYGLHTRVFITKEGLPTYEAKELALAKIKYDRYQYNQSIVITGNEINEYFKVVLKAMEQVYPELAKKTKHLSHGMLRLTTGKMSSRTGGVITAISLIDDIKKKVLEKMDPDSVRSPTAGTIGMDDADEEIAEQVAVGALKYEILKQSPGKDIIFDVKKSLSLEGDSGPYLQYTYVRAKSVLAKAQEHNLLPTTHNSPLEMYGIERLLYRFPEVVDEASRQYAPQKVVHFLLLVASGFNTFYAEEKIVDIHDTYSSYKLALTQAVVTVLDNGLNVLGVSTPRRM